MFSNLWGLIVATGVAVVPGAAALFLLGVRRPLWYVALSAPCSVAVASLVGLLCALLGVRFGVIALGIGSVAMAAGGVARQVYGRGSRTGLTRREAALSRLRTMPALIGMAVIAVGVCVSLLTWLGGMGWNLRTYPQEHDMIFHLVLSSYIARTGAGAPWQLAPVDVLSQTGTMFYPAGFHLLAGVSTQLTGSVVMSVNALAIVLVGIGFPLGFAVLTIALARAHGFSSPTALGAGGVASVLAATLYRPGVQLAHDGGILPNSIALSLSLGILAACTAWRRAGTPVLVATGLAVAGAVIVHPSALVTLGVTALVLIGVDLVRRGRSGLLAALRAFAPTVGIAVIVALPTLLIGSSAVAQTTGFTTLTPNRPVPLAVGKAVTFAYSGYLDPDSARAQVWAAGLVIVGLLVLLVARILVPMLVVTAVWFLVVTSYYVGPGKGPAGVITSFFYNSEPRVASHLVLVIVPSGALGVAVAARWLAGRLNGRTRPLIPITTVGLMAVLMAGYLAGPGYGYARTNETAIASRFVTPDFSRVDQDDETAAAWLASRVAPGERVLNSANDGSTNLYNEYGLAVVNLASLGSASVPYTSDLLANFRTFPTNPRIRAELRDLDVRWLYVDAEAPPIGVGGAPGNWPQTDRLTVPRGFLDLEGLPGLQPAFRAGSVTVYRLDPAVVLAP